MSTYRPNRRDPLTQRFAHSVRDTISDPWDYSEGPREPQYIDDGGPSFSKACTWGHVAVVVLAVVAAVVVVWSRA